VAGGAATAPDFAPLEFGVDLPNHADKLLARFLQGFGIRCTT